MIKLIQCVRANPNTDPGEFRKRWDDYGDRLRELTEELGAVRIVLNTTLSVDANRRIAAERGTLEPFDGVAEVWWERGYELMEKVDEATMREKIDRLQAVQESFLEMQTSSFFFALEEVVHEAGS